LALLIELPLKVSPLSVTAYSIVVARFTMLMMRIRR
jgi:hypothetical protein